MFLVLLDIILLLIIIQFAYIKIAFEMYGQYHLPRGKNPALSCLIGFVSMDRAKQQNYSIPSDPFYSAPKFFLFSVMVCAMLLSSDCFQPCPSFST